MKIYDVTVTLRQGMVTYPTDPPYRRTLAKSTAEGDGANVSLLEMGAHSGTHVDAPAHMDHGYAVDEIDPAVLVGPAVVVDARGAEAVGPEHLPTDYPDAIRRVLFRTDNGALWEQGREFTEDFVYLSGEAAEELARQNVALVGIDYLSIDKPHTGNHTAHTALMETGTVIVEALNLSGVPAGVYDLFCGPLKIEGGDGAPARVLLRDRSETC